MRKEYLGDAVYVEQLGAQLVLTTSDGIEDTNVIYLEASTMEALIHYYKKATGQIES